MITSIADEVAAKLLSAFSSGETFAARKVAMYEAVSAGMRSTADLPIECIVSESFPAIVKRVSDTLKNSFLQQHKHEIGPEEQVLIRELTDYLAAALLNSTPVATRQRLTREWLSSRMPYNFIALLCSPTEALVQTYGHRIGAVHHAEDILLILQARAAIDPAARSFVQNQQIVVSLPKDFEHLHRPFFRRKFQLILEFRCHYRCSSISHALHCRPRVWS